MYQPSFKISKTGVPILSKAKIDFIGENLVQDFQPEALNHPEPIDIDKFVEFYLGMTLDFQHLSHNGIYLGMTIFNESDKVIIYSPATNRAEYIYEPARTVIIDKQLTAEKQRHRYRFTMGHEAAHDILHSGYFAYDPNQMTLFDAPMIQCRVDNYSTNSNGKRTDRDWLEWQANALSSSILMPQSAVKKVVKEEVKTSLPQGILADYLTHVVKQTFDVSYEAAQIRLKELNIITEDTSITENIKALLS